MRFIGNNFLGGNMEFYITREELLMGRDKEYPLTPEISENIARLLFKANTLIDFMVGQGWNKKLVITSGWRPGRFNVIAGGSITSLHQIGLAFDAFDTDGELAWFLVQNRMVLEAANMYLENPRYTKGHCHLQGKAPKSGKFIFNPYEIPLAHKYNPDFDNLKI